MHRKVSFISQYANFFSETGEVYTWGYGLLGSGPKGSFSEQPVLLNRTLFGRNELQPDTKVVDVQCGLYHFAALTGKEKIPKIFEILQSGPPELRPVTYLEPLATI